MAADRERIQQRLDTVLPGRSARREGVPLLTVPEGMRSLRVHVPLRVALAVIVIAAVAAGILVVRVSLARAAAMPVSVSGSSGFGGSDAGSPPAGLVSRTVPSAYATAANEPSGSAATGTAVSPPPGPALVVHVVGQVRRPGLVRLPKGARVADAVAGAGGATPRAQLAAINLARPVVDGEQIVVPAPGEVVTAAGPGASASGTGAGLLDLNTAGLADLDALPGIGPVLAQRILDWRADHGRFTSIDELGEVVGIGDRLLQQLRSRVAV